MYHPGAGGRRTWRSVPGMDRRAGARGRRPGDWERDLAGARAGEAALGALLAAEPRVNELTDHTAGVDTLDFRFTYRGGEVWLDLKEKRRAYSPGVADLWPEVAPSDLFIVDELVYRRVVWQGGGGYLGVPGLPGRR